MACFFARVQGGEQVQEMTVKESRGRARWIKLLHKWHWISSAICLVGIILFAWTGITLNHAGEIEAETRTFSSNGVLPDHLIARLKEVQAEDGAVLPLAIKSWVKQELGVKLPPDTAEWSDEEVYVALPRPGGDAWLRIDRKSGVVDYEQMDRGWIAYLNDLHKGRHTGVAWSLFIDVFSVACLIFALTGLLLLQAHGRGRPMTWPIVGAGFVIPVFLALLFIH